jgi:hypothetical protein
LKLAIDRLPEYTKKWAKDHDTQELAGNLVELINQMGDISGHDMYRHAKLQDIKSLLRKAVLEPSKENKKFAPGSGPYTAMLQVFAYSRPLSQSNVLTLPFIPKELLHLYHPPVFDQGLWLKHGMWYNNGVGIDSVKAEHLR